MDRGRWAVDPNRLASLLPHPSSLSRGRLPMNRVKLFGHAVWCRCGQTSVARVRLDRIHGIWARHRTRRAAAMLCHECATGTACGVPPRALRCPWIRESARPGFSCQRVRCRRVRDCFTWFAMPHKLLAHQRENGRCPVRAAFVLSLPFVPLAPCKPMNGSVSQLVVSCGGSICSRSTSPGLKLL